MCTMAVGSYIAVMPGYIVEHLGLSTAALGFVMGASGAFAVLFRPLGGTWSDRYGRRPVATVGAAVLAAGSAVLLGPAVIVVIIFGRMLVGAGDSLFTVAAMAWVTDEADPKRRGRAMATIGMSLWLGLALGPQWAVWVHDNFGYRGVWLGAAGLGFGALLLAWLVGPSGRPATAVDRGARRLPPGALLPALAMVFVCYGNGVFEAFGIVHLTGRGVSGGAGLGGAASVFTVIALVTFVGRFAGGALSDHLGPRPVGLGGTVLVLASYVVLGVASSFAVAALGGVLLGLGLALVYPSLSLLAVRRVTPAERGAGIGMVLAALDLNFAIGPPLAGLLIGISSTGFALISAAGVSLLSVPVLLAAGNPPAGADEHEGVVVAEELPSAAV